MDTGVRHYSNPMASDSSGENESLSWTNFFDEKRKIEIDGDSFNVYLSGDAGPIFLLIHGGGYTGLTWACMIEKLREKIQCRVIAPDLRAHGETLTQDIDDLSLEKQAKDVCDIYAKILELKNYDKIPPLILVGHSMGGAIAVHIAYTNVLPKLAALAVIDVVEGSAMAALSMMGTFLRSRPQSFPSVDRAIRWCLESGMTRNPRAARVSMPSQIVADNTNQFRWRTNLSKTQSHWSGWFTGLSKKFLGCSAAKILILANVDRLDKELLTGQMRGMFQTEVLPKVGHAVHEDSPDLVADIFAKLVRRYQPILVKM